MVCTFLGGKTLLPGFIDTHGHFVYFDKNLVDANRFGCTDIADLDRVSVDRPVLVVDSSGHLGAANGAAFRAAGIIPGGDAVVRLWGAVGRGERSMPTDTRPGAGHPPRPKAL